MNTTTTSTLISLFPLIITVITFLIIGFVVIVLLKKLLILVEHREQLTSSGTPYQKPSAHHLDYSQIPFTKKTFLSSNEYEFFLLLQRIVGEEHYIFCQVRVEDFIQAPAGIPGDRNFIKMRSVDFLLVKKTDRTKIMAIELNDITHRDPDRIDRDDKLRTILSVARVPYMVEQAKPHYDVEVVSRSLQPFLMQL